MLTCAGPMKPSMGTVPSWRTSGDSRMWVMAEGVSTWQHKTLKLARPSRAASRMASAVGGVVVSKPMAKNTTSRCGFARARAMASAAE
ncbi:hypothetical protein FQZ97_1260800 [compost metagenome]